MVEVMAETIQSPATTHKNNNASIYSGTNNTIYCSIDVTSKLRIKILCHEQNLNLFDRFMRYKSRMEECPNSTFVSCMFTHVN